MTVIDQLKTLLNERRMIEEELFKAEEILISLEAYQKTILKSITKESPALSCPTVAGCEYLDEGIFIEDENPFYITNLGTIQENNQKGSSGSSLPVFYKTLRKYYKNIYSKTSKSECWYTTTILRKNDSFFFVISDDENNIWKGSDPFADFSNSFTIPMKFRNIAEWLGLHIPRVRYLIEENQKRWSKLQH